MQSTAKDFGTFYAKCLEKGARRAAEDFTIQDSTESINAEHAWKITYGHVLTYVDTKHYCTKMARPGHVIM